MIQLASAKHVSVAPLPVTRQGHITATAITFGIVAASSLLFCSKGVFVKSAYRYGTDPLTLLTIRMILALPVFLITLWASERDAAVAMDRQTLAKLVGLGFIGYYLSSIINFFGLQYISVGLERMVLYTYPTLVVLGSVVFFKARLKPVVVAAIPLTYLGIVVAWQGEARATGTPSDTILGVVLVFTSALLYAAFMLLSGRLIKTIGAMRFTSYVIAISAGFVAIHFLSMRSAGELLNIATPVWIHGAILAIFGTVLPSFLMGFGLARAGAQKFAIINTIGPVGTVFLAWLVLDETQSLAGIAGFIITLAGGIAVSLTKD